MTHVKLIVLPIPTKTSLPPKTVVLGSVQKKKNKDFLNGPFKSNKITNTFIYPLILVLHSYRIVI